MPRWRNELETLSEQGESTAQPLDSPDKGPVTRNFLSIYLFFLRTVENIVQLPAIWNVDTNTVHRSKYTAETHASAPCLIPTIIHYT